MPDVQIRELKLLEEPKRSAIDVFTKWLPRIAVAVVFLNVGSQKFAAHSMWVRIFAQIGLGQWFRYLTGGLQVGGALLVLVPRTFALGILLLACTMAGAVATWLLVLRVPLNAPIPGVLLVVLVAIGGSELWNLVRHPVSKQGHETVSNHD
jgi:putative oxidoreductase